MNFDNINNRIWAYVEKLYIHCYDVDSFVKFLRDFDIEFMEFFKATNY